MKANDDDSVNMSLMRPNCKDCDRLMPKPLGEAGERPNYYQTTMYDHLENFQQFQKAKKTQEIIERSEEKLLKLNPNFIDTDLLDNSQKDLLQFNSQNLLKIRKELSLAECNLLMEVEQALTTDKSETALVCFDLNESSKQDASQLMKGRSPITCPLSNCQQIITATMLLSHYLRDHNDEFGVQYEEIYLDKASNLIFDANSLEYESINCLGILIYGGRRNEEDGYPGERGICMNNAFLPKSFEQFYAHLPVLIMCYRTTWAAIITKGMVKADDEPRNPKNDLLIIWLASVQTTEDIFGTITLYNKEMTTSISSIVKLRCITDVQDPKEFVNEETDFIRLGYYDMKELSHNLSEYVHMELMINEYSEENLQKSHVQHKQIMLYRQRQYTRIMHQKQSLQDWLEGIETEDDKNSLSHSSHSISPSERQNEQHNETRESTDRHQNPSKESHENLLRLQSHKFPQGILDENIYEKQSNEQLTEATVSKANDKSVSPDETDRSDGKKRIVKVRLVDKKSLDGGSKYPHDMLSIRKCSREYRTMIKNSLRRKIKRALAAKRFLKQQQMSLNMKIRDHSEHPHPQQCTTRQDAEKQRSSRRRQQNGCANRMDRRKRSGHYPTKYKCIERSPMNKANERRKKVRLCVNQPSDGNAHGIERKTASSKTADCCPDNFHKIENEFKQNINQEIKNANNCRKDIENPYKQEGNSNHELEDVCKIQHTDEGDKHFTEHQKANVEGGDRERIVKNEDEYKLMKQMKIYRHEYHRNKAALKAELKGLLKKIHEKYAGSVQERSKVKEVLKLIKQLDKVDVKKNSREDHHLPHSCCHDENLLETRTEVTNDSNREAQQRDVLGEDNTKQSPSDEYSSGGKSLDECSPCRNFTDDCGFIPKLSNDYRIMQKYSNEGMQASQRMKSHHSNYENCERRVHYEIPEPSESIKKPARKQRIQGNEQTEKSQAGDNINRQIRVRKETRVQNEQRCSKRTKSLDVKAHHNTSHHHKTEKHQGDIDMNRLIRDKHNKHLEKDLIHMKQEKRENSMEQKRNNWIEIDCSANCTKKSKESNDKVKMNRTHSCDSSHELPVTNQMNLNSHKDEERDGVVVCNHQKDHQRLNECATDDSNESGHCLRIIPERIINKPAVASNYSRNHSFTKESSVISKNPSVGLAAATEIEEAETEGCKLMVGNAANCPHKLVIGNVPALIIPHTERNNDNAYRWQQIIESSDLESDTSASNLMYCLEEDDDDNDVNENCCEINSILKTVYESIPELSE